ncbi:MAG: hypothetical protein AAB152_06470 [Candidatus Coatesbacteria bacterium]
MDSFVRSTYADVARRATDARARFARYGIPVAAGSSLDTILAAPSELDRLRNELLTRTGQLKPEHSALVWRAADCNRILDAVEWLDGKPRDQEYLAKLQQGPLETFVPDESHAKDFEYELLMAFWLERGGLCPALEEPDLSFRVGSTKLGLACKHVYGLGALGKRLGKGRKQIAKWTQGGLVALALDELNEVWPTGQTVGGSETQVRATLRAAIHAFWERNAARINRQVSSPKVLGVILTLIRPVIVDLVVTTAHEMIIVSIVGPSDPRHKLLERMQVVLAGGC